MAAPDGMIREAIAPTESLPPQQHLTRKPHGITARKTARQREQQPSGQVRKQGQTPQEAPASGEASYHVRLEPRPDPLQEGYKALTAGRLEEAGRLYREALAKNPRERDALLGMAVIAHRRLQTEQAMGLYQQVLREDPENATATAAMVTLTEQSDPMAAESHLKRLLGQKPMAPELHYAFGSLLARQHRWSEAQPAFFRAHSLAPSNLLYAYNLAVSLDRLQQPAAALPYYEKSVQLIQSGDATLDRATIMRRVEELRRSTTKSP